MQYTKKVKVLIRAGNKLSQMKTIGYKVLQLIYDSPEMDCLVDQKYTEMVIYKRYQDVKI